MLGLLAAVVAGAAAIFFALRSRNAHAATAPDETSYRAPRPRDVRPSPAGRQPEEMSTFASAVYTPPSKPTVNVTPFELAPPRPTLPPPPPVAATPQRLLPDHNVAVQALITPGLLTKVESAAVGQALTSDLFSEASAAVKGFQLALSNPSAPSKPAPAPAPAPKPAAKPAGSFFGKMIR